MFNIQCHNNISKHGLALFPNERYNFTDNLADAILLRSYNLHDMTISSKLKAVARAGAGTNNIPIELLTQSGIRNQPNQFEDKFDYFSFVKFVMKRISLLGTVIVCAITNRIYLSLL